MQVTASATLDEFRVAAAWDGTHVGVAYLRSANDTTQNLVFSLLNPDGSLVSSVVLTAYGASFQGVHSGPSLSWNGSEYAVVWVQSAAASGSNQVILQRIKPDGTLPAKAVKVADGLLVGELPFPVWNAAVAWSSSYAGYAVAYGRYTPEGTRVVFRRVGPTGVALGPEVNFDQQTYDTAQLLLAAAPDGSWAIASAGNGIQLAVINADGTSTLPIQTLRDTPTGTGRREPGLAWDGHTWLSAFWDNFPGGRPNSGTVINRGASRNDPVLVIKEGPESFDDTLVSVVGISVVVGYTQRVFNQYGIASNSSFGMQRFVTVGDASSYVEPIHQRVELTAERTIKGPGDTALVATQAGKMLGVWADLRNGKRDLFARPVDLHSCP